jgi:hypothetical protein
LTAMGLVYAGHGLRVWAWAVPLSIMAATAMRRFILLFGFGNQTLDREALHPGAADHALDHAIAFAQ